MQCVRTISYSFLINDSPRGMVKPSRGIRQDDLCNRAHEEGKLKGIRVARGSPRVNHLLFADDTMFVCKVNQQSSKALRSLLKRYELASGQSINESKSSISFSRKNPQAIRDFTKQELAINKEGGVGKYLGLPEHFGKRKKDLFTSIVDRIRQRAMSWSFKFLSTAEKMVMVKSVLSDIPTIRNVML